MQIHFFGPIQLNGPPAVQEVFGERLVSDEMLVCGVDQLQCKRLADLMEKSA